MSIPSHAQRNAESAQTWLFVPGNRPELFAKAANSTADVIVFDLEGSVWPDEKDGARAQVAAWLRQFARPCAVRVNAPGTPWHAHDVAILSAAAEGPTLVVLAKTESVDEISFLKERFPSGSAVVAHIETALGVHHAADLARAPGVVRLALGNHALAAQIGVDPDYRPGLAGARDSLVLASAIGRLPGPVDGITGELHDLSKFRDDVAAAARLGFSAKFCVHPTQVEAAATSLRPPPADLEWAQRVLSVVATCGDSVIELDGRLVDTPVVTRAAAIVASHASMSELGA